MSSIQGSISSVLLPALSKEQENIETIKNITRKSIQTSSLLIFPLMFFLATISKPLILILYTEKWAFAIPFMQMACITYAFWHLHTTNLQVILALKRSDIYLILEATKKVLILISLAITLPFGVIWLALGEVILTPFNCIINSYPNIKLINYKPKEQISDCGPSIICSIISSISSLCASFFITNIFLTIAIQGVVFFTIFCSLAYICDVPLFKTFLDKFKEKILG